VSVAGLRRSQEVEFLRKRDVEGSIRFTDLNEPGYEPAEHGGVGFEEGMKVIHAVLPGGKTIKRG
jgi:predicted DCC family thiol-disulfide oxidoreductase YuxK